MKDAAIPKQRVFTTKIKDLKKLMSIMGKIEASDPNTPIISIPQKSLSSQSSQYRLTSSTQRGSALLHRDNELYRAHSVWEQADIVLRNNAKKIDRKKKDSNKL